MQESRTGINICSLIGRPAGNLGNDYININKSHFILTTTINYYVECKLQYVKATVFNELYRESAQVRKHGSKSN